MGFFNGLIRSFFGRGSEPEDAPREDVEAPPSPTVVRARAAPVAKEPAPAPRKPSPEVDLRVESADIERVTPVRPPPPPPAAAGVDLRNGVDANHFSSSILIGLEATLDDLARASSDADAPFINYIRKMIGARTIRLPTMPEAVVKIDAILRRPDASVTAVATCISAEPSIATKLVGIANSPFYASARRVASIDGAISRIGLRETKNVVQAVAFGARLFRVPGWEKEAERLYRHALVTAMAGRAVAEQAGLDGDELFMAGLVHDIGRMVLLTMVTDAEQAKKSRIAPALVERVSDRIHAELSALVAESWNASMETVVGTRYHHQPSIIGPPVAQRYGRVLELADGIARLLLEPDVAEAGLEAAVNADSVAVLAVAPYLPEIVGRVRENAGAFDVPLVSETRRAG